MYTFRFKEVEKTSAHLCASKITKSAGQPFLIKPSHFKFNNLLGAKKIEDSVILSQGFS